MIKDLPDDLTGIRFGRLVVIKRLPRNQYPRPSTSRSAVWECLCDCGNVIIVFRSHLKNQNTLSCGCRRKEAIAEQAAHQRKHGHSYGCSEYGGEGHGTFVSWSCMKTRCLDPKHCAYHRYGGRGIKICQGWLEFNNFLADMGNRPAKKTIERRDYNNGYWCGHCNECISNGWKFDCYWATRKEQMNNTSRNVIIEHNGRRMNIAQWAEFLGVAHSKLYGRYRKGWSNERMLNV